jgi:hypothetical protein
VAEDLQGAIDALHAMLGLLLPCGIRKSVGVALAGLSSARCLELRESARASSVCWSFKCEAALWSRKSKLFWSSSIQRFKIN